MGKTGCAGCGRFFTPRSNIPRQEYCSHPACQRIRKRRWQAKKLKADEVYQEYQCFAQHRWRKGHPNYWREYRKTHPEYTLNNREKQKVRDRKRRRGQAKSHIPCSDLIAKMDE